MRRDTKKNDTFRINTSYRTHKWTMDFLPGNNADEWQFLGSSTNTVPYQQVTLNQHMKWSTFSLECFVGSCSKFSGNGRLSGLT